LDLLGGKSRRTTAYQLNQEFRKFMNEQKKLHDLHKAMREVELFESYIHMLRTIHLDADEPLDWHGIYTTPPPFEPGNPGPNEARAIQEEAAYKPTLWDRLFGRVNRRRNALRDRVARAREEDEAAYRSWKEGRELAERILSGDESAYVEAVRVLNPFSDLAELGSDFTCYATEKPSLLAVEFRVHSDKIVPREVKTLTKTGKLSVSEMPVTRYNSLKQDYVCSTIFRVARDMFAILPITEVLVHATDFLMNEAVGRMEAVTIVSVRINKKLLESLNLEAIDPSEAISLFEHRMNFLKTKGFRAVEQLSA
jgi:hypothetical protein